MLVTKVYCQHWPIVLEWINYFFWGCHQIIGRLGHSIDSIILRSLYPMQPTCDQAWIQGAHVQRPSLFRNGRKRERKGEKEKRRGKDWRGEACYFRHWPGDRMWKGREEEGRQKEGKESMEWACPLSPIPGPAPADVPPFSVTSAGKLYLNNNHHSDSKHALLSTRAMQTMVVLFSIAATAELQRRVIGPRVVYQFQISNMQRLYGYVQCVGYRQFYTGFPN